MAIVTIYCTVFVYKFTYNYKEVMQCLVSDMLLAKPDKTISSKGNEGERGRRNIIPNDLSVPLLVGRRQKLGQCPFCCDAPA